ncbi:MAG: hypothetical protein IJU35_05080 [Paludibacteraceae bacterium]|nr:hypothetical protein [Paludibacteraceae bacterium]
MENILERIAFFAQNEGITIGSIEKAIGASKGVLSRALAQGTDIQSKWLGRIVENYPKLNSEWLLTGEGDMLKTNQQSISNIDNSNVVGANVNGTGININSNQSELLAIIRKQQEQMDKLIDTIAKMHQ